MKTNRNGFSFRLFHVVSNAAVLCTVGFATEIVRASDPTDLLLPRWILSEESAETRFQDDAPTIDELELEEWPPYPFEPKRGETLSVNAIRDTAAFAERVAENFGRLYADIGTRDEIERYFNALIHFSVGLEERVRLFAENEEALRFLAMQSVQVFWGRGEDAPPETVSAAFETLNALRDFGDRIGRIRMRKLFERALIRHLRFGLVNVDQAVRWMNAMQLPPEARSRILRKGGKVNLAVSVDESTRRTLLFEEKLFDAFESDDADDSAVRRAIRPVLDSAFPDNSVWMLVLADQRLSNPPDKPPFSKDRLPVVLLKENIGFFKDESHFLRLVRPLVVSEPERQRLLGVARAFEKARLDRLSSWDAVKSGIVEWWSSPDSDNLSRMNRYERKTLLNQYEAALEETSVSRLIRELRQKQIGKSTETNNSSAAGKVSSKP